LLSFYLNLLANSDVNKITISALSGRWCLCRCGICGSVCFTVHQALLFFFHLPALSVHLPALSVHLPALSVPSCGRTSILSLHQSPHLAKQESPQSRQQTDNRLLSSTNGTTCPCDLTGGSSLPKACQRCVVHVGREFESSKVREFERGCVRERERECVCVLVREFERVREVQEFRSGNLCVYTRCNALSLRASEGVRLRRETRQRTKETERVNEP
jgi:hypothetical protein